MASNLNDKEAFAYSVTKWYAECTHCGATNNMDPDACKSGASSW